MSYLFLLATECLLPAGDSSLRYYRETKPGKENMSCFSPHPINFVTNKSDAYRTAVSRSKILLAGFLLKCAVVLRVNIILLSQNVCCGGYMWSSLTPYLTWTSTLGCVAGIRQHDLTSVKGVVICD